MCFLCFLWIFSWCFLFSGFDLLQELCCNLYTFGSVFCFVISAYNEVKIKVPLKTSKKNSIIIFIKLL